MTPEHKRAFIEYLQSEVNDGKLLIEQAKKLSGMAPVITRLSAEVAAHQLVLIKLLNTKSFTLTAEGGAQTPSQGENS